MPEFIMTEDDLTPEMLREGGRGEIRVVFTMADWDDLEYLVDDSTDEPTDLPNVFLLAWEAANGRSSQHEEDLSCEGEEEGDVWAWYCRGMKLDALREVVGNAVPEGFTVKDEPVSEGSYSDAQLAIVRQ